MWRILLGTQPLFSKKSPLWTLKNSSIFNTEKTESCYYRKFF